MTNFIKFTGNTPFNPQIKPVKVEKVKKTKINPRSDKRAKQERMYAVIRPIFLEGKICPITKEPATQVHHRKGRIGDLLCDVRFFLGVSAEGHDWIEANPEESYKLGYSLLRNAKDGTNDIIS